MTRRLCRRVPPAKLRSWNPIPRLESFSMFRPAPSYPTLEKRVARESIPFSLDSSAMFSASVDQVVKSLDSSVKLLGFGEAMHGDEDILKLRNRLFQRLVSAYGFTSIALESSFPRARMVNEYVAGL